MDTKFSTAIHILIMISDIDQPISSEILAKSTGTNPSYIRKIISLLKKKGLINSKQGVPGFELCFTPEEINLIQIFKAVNSTDSVHLLDIHKNPNGLCIYGKCIKPTLSDFFFKCEKGFEESLKAISLKDCIDNIHNRQKELLVQ